MITQKQYDKFSFYLLLLVALAMPTTKIILSWSTVLLSLLFIIGPGLIQRVKSVWAININKLIILFFGFNCIALFWSLDALAGLKLIKGYIPFLILPMILSTITLNKKQIENILATFIAALLFTSIYNVCYINGLFGTINGDDFREMSQFGSHIRYAVLIVFGVLILFESIKKKIKEKKSFYIQIGITIWLLFYTFYSQVLSGLICLIILCVIYFSSILYKRFNLKILTIICGTLFVSGAFVIYKMYPNKETNFCQNLPKYTALGNPYVHDCTYYSEINNLPVYAYYCKEELFSSWNERSNIDIMDNDKRNHPIRMTLARYLTAKELTKDAAGVSQLSESDIHNIEQGKVYSNENKDLFMTRLYSLKYELMNAQDPNGKSFLQRVEHWRTSLHIIKSHFLFGVGTGGNQKAFDKSYQETNSSLDMEHRLRSHNQYFAIQIGLGIIGSFLFLALLFQIGVTAIKSQDHFTFSFLAIMMTSFIMEDSLETQVGAYTFGFFMLFILQNNKQKNEKE